MTGIDISALRSFSPARYRCERCLGLMKGVFLNDIPTEGVECTICAVRYQSTSEFSTGEFWDYLHQNDLGISFRNLIEHCLELASIADRLRIGDPPVSILFDALNMAERFVHFTTYGISHQFIGALKLVAQRAQVRGVVSLPISDNDQSNTTAELEDANEEFSNFCVKVIEVQRGRFAPNPTPHQKVLVIDSLLGFKGSTNLTLTGWRNSAKRLDLLEVVTNTDDVISLNNKYFSPVWMNPEIEHIRMGDASPFDFEDESPF